MLILLALAAAPTPAEPPLVTLRRADARLAAIAWRLQTANTGYCRDLQPAPGVQLHAIDQYGAGAAGARRLFGFATPVQVEAVVPGSPAAVAGILPDDGLVAVAETPVAAPATDDTATARTRDAATARTRDAAEALIDAQPADRPLLLTLVRAGVRRDVSVPASPGCRSAFEVLPGPGLAARSDGRTVQLDYGFFPLLPDDQLAAVAAHELSHTILRHRARLEAAGAKWGMLAEFGRNGRLFRRTEDDADALSVHLMRNAGYDPQAAVRFWREEGRRIDGGPFRGASHAAAGARADAIAAEAATLPPPGRPDPAPPVLATRDQPLR